MADLRIAEQGPPPRTPAALPHAAAGCRPRVRHVADGRGAPTGAL